MLDILAVTLLLAVQDPRTALYLLPGEQLSVETYGNNLPLSTRLVLSSGKQTKIISSLGDLKGKVNISTAERAVEFVRLADFDAFFDGLNSVPVMEAMSVEQARKTTRFDPRVIMDGWQCMVTSPDAAQICKQYPKIEAQASRFRVTRLLVKWVSTSKFEVAKVTEEVGSDGSWKVIKTDNRGLEPLKKIDWFFPPRY